MRATRVAGLRVSHLSFGQWAWMIDRHRACNGRPFKVIGVLPGNPGVEILVPRGAVPETGPWVEASTAKAYEKSRYPREIGRRSLDEQADVVTVEMPVNTVVYNRQGSGATYQLPRSKRFGREADISNILLICASKTELEAMRVDEIIEGRSVVEVPRTTGPPVALALGLIV